MIKRLDKRTIKKVPVENINEAEMSEILRTCSNTKWIMRVQNRRIGGTKMLVVYIYRKDLVLAGKRSPEFRMFISKTDFVTQDFNPEPFKWRTGALDGLDLTRYWKKYPGSEHYIHEDSIVEISHVLDDDSVLSLRRFFGDVEANLDNIVSLQSSIIKQRMEARHQIEIDKIDARMKDIHALPKDFRRWLLNKVMRDSRYFFYERGGKGKHVVGYCSHCRHEVEVIGPQHGKDGKCPRCHSKIRFRAKSIGTNIFDYNRAAIIQRTPDGFVVRYFRVYHDFRDNYKEPRLSYQEYARDFFNEQGKLDEIFWFAQFKQTGIYRWCVNPGIGGAWNNVPTTAVLYSKNLKQALQGTLHYDCGLDLITKYNHNDKIEVFSYLTYYRRIPQFKYLTRLGMFRLIDNLMEYPCLSDVNTEATTLQGFLRVKDYYAKILRENNAGIRVVTFAQKLDSMNIKLSADDLFYGAHVAGKNMLEIIQRFHMKRKINYIRRQSERLKMEPRSVESDWCDYISFCEELKMDTNNPLVAFPKNLAKAHDRTWEQLSALRDKEKRKKIERLCKQADHVLQEFGNSLNWENDNYLIRLPKDHKELKKEGEDLSSCVGKYYDRIAAKSSLILFLRRKNKADKSFFTLQLRDGNIIQARGKSKDGRQADPTPEIKKVIQAYVKTLPERAKIYNKIMHGMDENAEGEKAA